MHLHILPAMNPDGFALRWRGNANNIDLNRDFPDQVSTLLSCSFFLMEASASLYYFFCHSIDTNRNWQFFPVNNDINHRQPETKAIMNWVNQEHFTASASLHGVTIVIYPQLCNIIYHIEMRTHLICFQGALVANYPWDGTSDTGWFLILKFSFKYLNSQLKVLLVW